MTWTPSAALIRAALAEVCTFAAGARSARGGRSLFRAARRNTRGGAQCAALCLALFGTAACSKRDAAPTPKVQPPEVQPMPRPAIEAVLERHSPELMRRAGIVGVYQSVRDDGTPAITVMVLDSTVVPAVPRELEGYPVDVEISGPVRPLDGKP